MSDVVSAYQNALKALAVATTQAESVAIAVQDIARKMTQWKRVMVSNIGGVGYPVEAIAGGYTSVNADQWPTPEKLHNALIAYHKAVSNVQAAWNAIPHDSRIGLTPPPI